ncbi:expressed unknown protein [Ectocarpus siliculosus]|uniref:ELM2 domain-containing protein n=1 Tax=Ectocarpus siliculosus TaxID=2880 RepID=D7G9E3_ECTSI|nr:expressed unknown protein [Ectocarpus siliculosus]|eukprot:CBJ28283.1 expressed unknown protein [Ectocarpus siliculosus]
MQQHFFPSDVCQAHESPYPMAIDVRHRNHRLCHVSPTVLSMWEDTFTGLFKFHARWLVHSSDLPEDAFARLQAARRAFAGEWSESGSDSGPDHPAKSDDMEWKQEDEESGDDDDDDNDSDSTGKDQQPFGAPPRKSARRKKPLLANDDDDDDDGKGVKRRASGSSSSPVSGTPPTLNSRLSPRSTTHAKRPRRLAMPPVEGNPSLSARLDSENTDQSLPPTAADSGVTGKDRRPNRVRTASAGAAEGTPPGATPSPPGSEEGPASSVKRRLSIAGKRKRGRPAKTAVEESDYPPQRTLVGDGYQADIPDLLPAGERQAAAPTAAGTGAKMVWRSIRDWDPHSRGMLSSYLEAAKKAVQAKQSRPGVAIHVRLGGEGDKGGTPGDKSSVASSYAVWAVTAGRNAGSNARGVARVGCSEMAQTEVPMSAIQRVQCEEEALAALVKARCTLDDFDPALKILVGDEASPESIQPWTLQQVRTLEQALAKDYNRDRRLHGWAREGMDMDREDFIDLADVSKQVSGKSPTQVLCFFYRYLATAEPLTDVVYGEEAAEARKREAILPTGSPGRPARESNNSTFRPAAKHMSLANPSSDSVSAATYDPPADRKSSTHAVPLLPASEAKGRLREREDVRPPKHTVSPPMRSTVSPAVDHAPRSHGPAGANGNVGGEYERQRAAAREQMRRTPRDMPPGVEVLEVDDSDDGAEVARRAPRGSVFHAAGSAAQAATARGHHPSTGGRGWHAAAHAREMSWGPRPIRPRPVPPMMSDAAAAADQRRYLPTAARPVIPPNSHGRRTTVAMPRHAGQQPPRPQQQQQQQQQHPYHIRREVGDDRMGRYSAAYEDRREELLEQDVFGFMGPCWSLLERAQAYLDQDQLVYMRGLILRHVEKPMTRAQLLERAESCLAEQRQVFAAFVKTFDRVDLIHAEAPPVPFYPAMKTARDDPPESVSYRGRMHAHADDGGVQPPFPYSRVPAAVPREYAVPPGASAARARPNETYRRVAAAAGVDARRERQPMPQYAGVWGKSVGRGYQNDEAVPPHRLAGAPYRHPSPPRGPASAARPGMMYREDGRDREARIVRSWPQQRQQQRSYEWRTDGPSSSSAPPVPPEAHASGRRVSEWRHGRAGGWS